ncbi:hypothetical protein HZC27_04665 [Candidatus Roizmanbacteria bacterium]|nr:hypothetical protein [Candidatus Roizmanbacteria bacterium]
MKLPFFSDNTPPRDYYFGLFLKENKGIGYIISGANKKLSLVAKKEFTYTNGWESLTQNVDDALFKLENETKCRIEKTIFFLFSHLVDSKTKEIKKLYLQKIKELTKSIEIKPIGYIECYEAVASYLQTKEGTPLTSILIELDDTNIDIFIYKGGHKMHNYVIARTDNIIDDLHSVLDDVGRNTNLPNRIILYNSSGLVEESTKIISHKWSPDLFVQLPRVEILKEEHIFEGLLAVFEEQIYRSAPSSQSALTEVEPKEVLGFVVGQDVGESVIKQSTPPPSPKKFFRNLKIPSFSTKGGFKKQYLWALLVVFGIGASLFLFEFYLHKALVTATFASFPIEKKITTSGVFDQTKDGFLTVQSASSSVAMKDVKITTGKRDIGEKAKGEVTVYNFDDKDKVFSKGTLIQLDNFKFVTDDEVKVAASTLASDASAKLPGKSKVKVTAQDIGTESNVDKSKRFKIADLSQSIYFAMNDVAFIGGTRKTVRTVSSRDQEDLKVSLLQKAKDQQKQEILKTQDKQVTLLDSLMDFQLTDVKFSKELGEEGENLSLQAKVVAKYYYFDTTLMNAILKKEIGKDIPSGYTLEDKNLEFKIISATKDKTGLTIQLSLKAKGTKKIDTKNVMTQIRGKQVSSVEELLKSEYGTKSSSIEVQPPLIFIKNMLPLFERNITLTIESP